MPFEFLGTDISQPEGRDTFAEVYSYFNEREFEAMENLHLDEILPPWIDKNPEEAKEFLTFCSIHTDPNVRRGAAIAWDLFINVDPALTIDMIEKLLADEDPKVRSAAGYYNDILGGEEVLGDFFSRAGLSGIHRLIKAVETANY